MRVEVTTVEDFCAELEAEAKATRVHDGIVRIRVDRVPEQDEEISHVVQLWATALIQTDEGQWVLEYGKIAGVDSPADPDKGTKVVQEWQKAIEDTADRSGLQVRRGKIEIW